MAIDGLLINQLQASINTYLPAKINKLQCLSEFEIIFNLRTTKGNKKLLISLHSVYNRIHFTQASYTTMESPTNFLMVLRKQIDGAIIKNITQIGLDRILKIELEARNELGDIHTKFLYVELMGKYANLILVDENNKIIDACKRIPPFENTRRMILPNIEFTLPDAQLNKKDPYTHPTIDENIPFTKQFHGFSPLLGKEVQFRMHNGHSFDEIMHEIHTSQNIYISDIKDQTYFHCIELTHLNVHPRIYDMMHGFDILFSEKEEKIRIKQQSGDLFKLVKKELNKNRSKLPKLQDALDEAMDCDKYREYGDLLFAYEHTIQREKQVKLPSFETQEMITIPIDMRFTIKQNANRYYQKYHKNKRAQSILLEQIDLCKKEIDYFETLEQQLSIADSKSALEIREELIKNHYMRETRTRIRKRKKNETPNYLTFQFDGYIIYVGKNNIQNDYITWHLAHKNDTWLHTKDLCGSHVIITLENPNETALRQGAMLAAWYSNGRYSSSVAVNYCLQKQLKKIPGHAGSFVSLSNYKTIYIDPDADYIQELHDQNKK